MTDLEFYEDSVMQYVNHAVRYKRLPSDFVRTREYLRETAKDWALIADSFRPKETRT